MKKIYSILMLALLLCMTTGCASKGTANSAEKNISNKQQSGSVVAADTAGKFDFETKSVLLNSGYKKQPLPKLAVLISPWTSFSNQLPSRIHNNKSDKILGSQNKRFNYEVLEPGYGKGTKVTDPYLSPLYTPHS